MKEYIKSILEEIFNESDIYSERNPRESSDDMQRRLEKINLIADKANKKIKTYYSDTEPGNFIYTPPKINQ